MLTSKQRILAAFEGRPVDRFPVASPYIYLFLADHWTELTGKPAWTYYEWLIQDPSEHSKLYADFLQQVPFDVLQPWHARSREDRQQMEVIAQDGKHYYRNRRSGDLTLLNEYLPHANSGIANQKQYVFDREDVKRAIKVTKAAELLASGRYDFIREAAELYGHDVPILNGVVGTFWQCTTQVGETNLFSMLYDAPDLIQYLEAHLLEVTIEDIRALAAAGDDAIYIDDALSTQDLISVEFYEKFSLPYVKAMVDEIHRLGKKAVLIYFGGVGDRVAQIASLGADAFSMEATMKNYTNDLAAIATQVGQSLCLWGNIDPVTMLQDSSDEELRAAIASQVEVGRGLRGFVISTGSPITPLTPIPRVRRFIELAHELGRAKSS